MPELTVEHADAALVVTLSRPDKRNAFSMGMLERFDDALHQAEEEGSVRAVVITGAGQSFSAGMDLSVLLEHLSARPTGEKIRRVQRRLQELFVRLEELEKPTLAAIEGSCVGGGLELALACDLRVCAQDATLGFPEARIGMLPDLGGTVRLTRLAGPATAKEWIFTGRQYPAQRAWELGLLNELTPPGQALPRAMAWVKELAGCAPLALAWTKRVVDRSIGMPLREGLELEQDAMTELLPSEDLREGVQAFLEKRPARFRGT